MKKFITNVMPEEILNNSNIGKSFINGKWLMSQGRNFKSISPIDGSIVWQGCAASKKNIDDAVFVSKNVQTEWVSLSLDDKVTIIERFCELVKRDVDKLAYVVSLEIGKPFWESKTEVAAVSGKLAPSLDAYKNRASSISVDAKIQGIDSKVSTEFKPHGVVAVIGPYNFPLHMPNGHIIPALLAGNAIIFKPSEGGTLSAHYYMELWDEAGLPKGLINMLPGKSDVGNMLVEHIDINSIFFTGSSSVGKLILDSANKQNKLCALEMGGDGVVYVHNYDDVTGAIKTIIQSSFITAGQRCSTGRQILMSESVVADGFIEKLKVAVENIKIGSPFEDPQPFYGPMRNPGDVNGVREFFHEAKEWGGDILLEPSYSGENGQLVSPGIVMLDNDVDWNPGEVVGPMIRIRVVPSIEAAIETANAIELRLIAGIISKDRDVYEYFANSVHYGGINWNCSTTGNSGWAVFGGYGNSGNYRPSGLLATDYCVVSQSRIDKPTSVVNVDMPGLTV